jgi:hypothetical protein
MTPELDQHIREKYPKIFQYPCEMSIDDGWFDIIDMLCANIQSHINQTRRNRHDSLLYNRALSRAICGDFSTYSRLTEWHRQQLDEDLDDIEPQLKIVPCACPQVVVSQIKEKFGTLRFYYTGGDEYVDGLEHMAESMSAKICENCGCPGESRSTKKNHYIRVLCDKHAIELGYIEDEDSISQ